MSSILNKILDASAALGFYDRWANRNLSKVHEVLIELADLHKGEEILDVGCGTGILGLRLAEVCDDIVVHGLDIGPRMISVAKKKAVKHHSDSKFLTGSAVELPYLHEQLDTVFSCLVFHLLQDSEKEAALKDVFRVLKPGGRYVSAEFEQYPAGFFSRKLLKYPSGLINSAGFQIVKEFGGPSITRHRPIVYRVLLKPRTE